MWAEAYQPLMSRLVQESLIKLCSENLPSPQDSCLELDAIVCITSGKGISNQIVIKLHKVIEVAKNNTWHEPQASKGDRSGSPWQIPLEKIRNVQTSKVAIEEGPVDLTGSNPNNRSILQYTSESVAPHLVNINSGANSGDQPLRLSNGSNQVAVKSELIQHLSGANNGIYKGAIPVPGGDTDNESNIPEWKSDVLNKLTKLQPPNYKPLPHLKLKSPVKNSEVATGSVKNMDASESSTHPDQMQCKICSLVCYGGFPSLQSHTQEIHRRYLCKFCYNTFSLRCNLKRHERLHVGVKPYNCKVCNKSFARSTDLKLHMQKHGLSGSDVVVPCPKCPRTFLSVQNLRWHLYKVHKESETSYACTICEKLFLDKDEWMKHREEHTNGLTTSPNTCNATLESQDADFMEFGPDDSMDGDSDNENLYIDTQSEGTIDSAYKDDDALPNLEQPMSNESNNDLGFELINESVSSPKDAPNHTSTPSIGSRKRKKGNPTKHVDISSVAEDFTDIDSMYYNSPLAKQKQSDKEKDVSHSHQGLNDEPQDLVVRVKPRMYDSNPTSNSSSTSNTPEDYSIMNKASNTMRQIADTIMNANPHNLSSLQNAIPAQGFLPPATHQSLGNSWDSSNFKNLKGALTGQSPVSFPGHKTPELKFSQSRSFSPLTFPITITPDSNQKYRPVRPSPKTAIKSTPGEPVDLSLLALLDDPNREFQCGDFGCNETYLGFSAYEDHCMIRHGRYPCKHCKQTFSGKNNRTRHMRCHVGAKIYTCPDCFKNFSRPDSMREHQFIHTLSYQEDKCRNCGFAFDKKNLLLAHLKQCYRHKMETGKSTKLIDETPAYLNHVNVNNTKDSELDFKPLQPMDFKPLLPSKMESLPLLSSGIGTPALPFTKAILPSQNLVNNRLSPMLLNSIISSAHGSGPHRPIVIAPHGDITPSTSLMSMNPVAFAQYAQANTHSPVPVTTTSVQQRAMSMSPLPSHLQSSSKHELQQRAMSASPVQLTGSTKVQQNQALSMSRAPLSSASIQEHQSIETGSSSPINLQVSSDTDNAKDAITTSMDEVPVVLNSNAISNPVPLSLASVQETQSNETGSWSPINLQVSSDQSSDTNNAKDATSMAEIPVALNSNAPTAPISESHYNITSVPALIPPSFSTSSSPSSSPPPSVTTTSTTDGAVAVTVIAAATPGNSFPEHAATTSSIDVQTPSSVNSSVINAMKNLIKSRVSPMSPSITDQNANKTPGVESLE